MTGPENYEEATRILDGIASASKNPAKAANHPATAALASVAQVHATLALAAATALDPAARDREWAAWFAVAGTKRPSSDCEDDAS